MGMQSIINMIIGVIEEIYALAELACTLATALVLALCDFCIWALTIYRSFSEGINPAARPIADSIALVVCSGAQTVIQIVKHYVTPLYPLSGTILINIIWSVACSLFKDPTSAMDVFIAFYTKYQFHKDIFIIMFGFCEFLYVMHCLSGKYPAREDSKKKWFFTRSLSELSRSERRHYHRACLAFFIIFWFFW